MLHNERNLGFWVVFLCFSFEAVGPERVFFEVTLKVTSVVLLLNHSWEKGVWLLDY